MFIKIPKSWQISENQATPHQLYRQRRQFLKGSISTALAAKTLVPRALGGVVGAMALSGGGGAASANPAPEDPTYDLYPVPQNPNWQADRPLTSYEYATTYNNYYEFGSHKQIWRNAQDLPLRPWTITIDGLVEREQTIDIDQILRSVPLEERIYRLRCVEAWAMIVPWSGFPMRALLDLARPLSSARYVRMESFHLPDIAAGQRQFWYPWPYVEGLTIEEAAHELSFLVTGLYGQPLPKQNGAPLRLAVPWKYGFKSTKGIVRFHFTNQRPLTFWQEVAGNEYGFWANVNPDVPHARWSQATEDMLGGEQNVPTQLFNGYAQEVAGLYSNLQNERLYF